MARFAIGLFAAALAFSPILTSSPASAGDGLRVEIAILNAAKVATQLRHYNPVNGVALVNLVLFLGPPFAGNEEPYEVAILAQQKAASVNLLRAALNANPATHSALSKRGIALSRVVGAEIAGGWVRVYFQ